MRLLKSHPLISLANRHLVVHPRKISYRSFFSSPALKNEWDSESSSDSNVSSVNSSTSNISDKLEESLDKKMESYEKVNTSNCNIKQPLYNLEQKTEKVLNSLGHNEKSAYNTMVEASQEKKDSVNSNVFRHFKNPNERGTPSIEVVGRTEVTNSYSSEEIDQLRLKGEGYRLEKKSIFATFKANLLKNFLADPNLKKELEDECDSLNTERSNITRQLRKIERLERIENEIYELKANRNETPTEYVASLEQTLPMDIIPFDD